MKRILLVLMLLPYLAYSQGVWTTHSFNHDGKVREYKMYVPATYDGATAVPVVFCLHGLGDNMNNFSGIGMNYVADTANFIVITPQALTDPFLTQFGPAWNSGAMYSTYTLNGNVDDIGFLGAIIDTLDQNYNVNLEKVFSCGFSMGGFMSQRLACEYNGRIAAVASVAGTIGSAINCNPIRPVPVCHFHGTGDSTVYYQGNQFGNDAEVLVDFWQQNNNCSSGPIITNLPDVAADGYTVTHTLYSSCDENAEVELYRVDSAEHVWLTPANDIFYTTEIWKFFMKHQHQNLNVKNIEPIQAVEVYPNPANTNAFVEFDALIGGETLFEVYDALGQKVIMFNKNITRGINTIDLNVSELNNGLYFVKIIQENHNLSKKLLIAH